MLTPSRSVFYQDQHPHPQQSIHLYPPSAAPTPVATAYSPYRSQTPYGSPTATAQFVSPPRLRSNFLQLPSQRPGSASRRHSDAPPMPSSRYHPDLPDGEFLARPPDGMASTDEEGNKIRYLEVPVIEEVIRHVPKYEQIFVEKVVPKINEVWVDKVVEVPQIVWQEKLVEVPVVEEELRHVPKKEIVTVEKEYIRHVPKIETVVVEKLVEIPGGIVEVPKPYRVEQKVFVPKVIDKQVPVLVAQLVQPMITGLSDEVREVVIPMYEPNFHVIDVPVARALPSTLINRGVLSETCRVVQVPAGQYNTILRHMNQHLDNPEKQRFLPYVPDPVTNQVDFLDDYMPGGPIAVPMPMLNSPQPAYAGAKIAAPLVPGSPGYYLRQSPPPASPVYPHGYPSEQPQFQNREIATNSTRHHGKPRSHRSTKHSSQKLTARSIPEN